MKTKKILFLLSFLFYTFPTIDDQKMVLAVTNGIRVIPPWGSILTTEEIEAVAYYVFISTSN